MLKSLKSGMAVSLAALFVVSLARTPQANADLETTALLPQGIFAPVVTFGVMSGLDSRFNSDGMIQNVTDQYHIQLMGSTLANLDPRLQQLINILNASSNQNLGNQLSVGTLGFSSQPVVTYFAPQIDYGITDNFTVGVGFPIIHYTNSMSIVAGGVNNANAIHNAVGSLSPEADAAFNTLANLDIPSTLQQVLAEKGYMPIRNVDETNIGDVVLSGEWKYYSSLKWRLALRPYIQIPTGTKPDPNDLESFATGGQPAIGAYSIHEYFLSPTWIINSSVGYQANIQDSLQMRVPTGPDDILPGQDRLDEVTRRTGNSTYLESGLKHDFSHALNLAGYYDLTFKDPDWYTGDQPGWNYGILSNGTDELISQFKAQLTFSTVDMFGRKAFAIPLQAQLIYETTIYAINAPNVTSTLFYLRMFF